jgi:hypothetical protein
MAPAFTGTWQPFIWDRTCARPLATHPDDRPGNRLDRLRDPRHPYSVLLPVGFTVPTMSPWPRWALTPPFHPYLPRKAVCFLWHFPWGRPRRTLSGTVFPWSPDFPPSAAFRPLQSAAAQPTGRRCLAHARRKDQRETLPRENERQNPFDSPARPAARESRDPRRCGRSRPNSSRPRHCRRSKAQCARSRRNRHRDSRARYRL